MIGRWGNASPQRWRSNADAAPPAVPPDSPKHPSNQARYRHISTDLLPRTASIHELTSRVLTYWHAEIRPEIAAGRHVWIVAHRDTLRAIISHLDNRPSACFADLTIQTAYPNRYRIAVAHPRAPT